MSTEEALQYEMATPYVQHPSDAGLKPMEGAAEMGTDSTSEDLTPEQAGMKIPTASTEEHTIPQLNGDQAIIQALSKKLESTEKELQNTTEELKSTLKKLTEAEKMYEKVNKDNEDLRKQARADIWRFKFCVQKAP